LGALGLGRKVMVVSDDVVAPLHLDKVVGTLASAGYRVHQHVVAAGETSKSPKHTLDLVDGILSAGFERTDWVLALGGGVVGDLAGFAAAISLRGLPFVQVPTTLLAQVDSSVGGKTGVNARQGKNLIGAFHQPAIVVSDIALLDSLPLRHRRAGYAEIVKMALIADREEFARLEALGAAVLDDDLAATIETAVRGKAAVVAADEREGGRRALLNLGHTFAHAIEKGAGYDDRVVHGEAVGLGLVLAFRLSAKLGLCAPAEADRVCAHLGVVGLPTTFGAIPAPLTVAGMQSAMAQDKKVKDEIIRFVLARGIGQAEVSAGVPPGEIAAFLHGEGLPLS
ncbi:MAG: 3-dehydroquinate synthase, partial [Pseudomonadota bacterium]